MLQPFLGPGELLGKTTTVKPNARTVIWNDDLSCVQIYITPNSLVIKALDIFKGNFIFICPKNHHFYFFVVDILHAKIMQFIS